MAQEHSYFSASWLGSNLVAFSVLCSYKVRTSPSTAWLSFVATSAIQLLVRNPFFAISMSTAWDNVVEEYLGVPQPWRFTNTLRFMVLIGPGTSTIALAIFFHNWFYYCLQSGTHIKVIGLFQSGLVSSRDSWPNPPGSHPSHWRIRSYTGSFCRIGLLQRLYDLSSTILMVYVLPIAGVLQMAGPRKYSTSCSLVHGRGSRWFCICLIGFTSNSSSNCSRVFRTKVYWPGIPRDLSRTCFPFHCFDLSRLAYVPLRSS